MFYVITYCLLLAKPVLLPWQGNNEKMTSHSDTSINRHSERRAGFVVVRLRGAVFSAVWRQRLNFLSLSPRSCPSGSSVHKSLFCTVFPLVRRQRSQVRLRRLVSGRPEPASAARSSFTPLLRLDRRLLVRHLFCAASFCVGLNRPT